MSESTSLPDCLDSVRIGSLPPAAYYISDFISEKEEKVILEKIGNAPKPRWKQLTHRRLQTWPSALVKDTLIDAPLPGWLDDPVVTRLLSLPVKSGDHDNLFVSSPHARPNHVLINEYPPGVGIMPHQVGFADWQSLATEKLMFKNRMEQLIILWYVR
jgi:alkylated DNA repair protein alkB family protein 6